MYWIISDFENSSILRFSAKELGKTFSSKFINNNFKNNRPNNAYDY